VSTPASRLRAALVALSVVWAAAVVAAPLARAGHGHWGVEAFATVPYLVGTRICHQRPERSFHTQGVAWPVCGRCAGLYLSGATALLAAAVMRSRRDRPFRALLPVAAVPTMATWGLEAAGLWDPGTGLRALAAVPLGLAIGWTLHAALEEGPGETGQRS
jgi:uncharacterized membrane protein